MYLLLGSDGLGIMDNEYCAKGKRFDLLTNRKKIRWSEMVGDEGRGVLTRDLGPVKVSIGLPLLG